MELEPWNLSHGTRRSDETWNRKSSIFKPSRVFSKCSEYLDLSGFIYTEDDNMVT